MHLKVVFQIQYSNKRTKFYLFSDNVEYGDLNFHSL